MSYVGGNQSYRFFKIISVNNKIQQDEGRYKTRGSPGNAAKKAFTQLSRKKNIKKLTLTIKETTQGSSKKEYGPYVCEKVKLKKPIEVKYKGKTKPVLMKTKTKIHLVKKRKQKGGVSITGLYGYLRRKKLNKKGNLNKNISNKINNGSITTFNDINGMISNSNGSQPQNNNFDPDNVEIFDNNVEKKNTTKILNSNDNAEKKLWSALNFKSLITMMKVKKISRNTIKNILQNDYALSEVLDKTVAENPVYIYRFYQKLLNEKNSFFINKEITDKLKQKMEVIIDNLKLEPCIGDTIEGLNGSPFGSLVQKEGNVWRLSNDKFAEIKTYGSKWIKSDMNKERTDVEQERYFNEMKKKYNGENASYMTFSQLKKYITNHVNDSYSFNTYSNIDSALNFALYGN